MRKAVFQLITSDLVLSNLLPTEKWFLRSSVPDTPPKPFGVLGYDGSVPPGPGRRPTRLTVGAYQERGSYDVINAVLDRVELIMGEVVGFKFEGDVLAQAHFEGRGPDLYDDGWRANYSTSSFTLIGS